MHTVAVVPARGGSKTVPLKNIRDVSAEIAAAVAEVAYQRDLARRPRPENLLEYIRSQMYSPDYEEYV